ncbi:hypothetical protein BKM17_10185 [Pseudomonas syringae group genomosp. 3]|nr:hypothetical protein BKM17_10185 [Pseudomonas syringae group genomosp. 3]
MAILPGDPQHAWGVEVPDIPGYFSASDDLDDAMAMAPKPLRATDFAEDGAQIPNAQKVTLYAQILAFEGCTRALVDIDVTNYMGKAEKLNIPLPAHLLTRIVSVS